MSRPSNEQLIALREETEKILGAADGETITAAAARVVAELAQFRDENSTLQTSLKESQNDLEEVRLDLKEANENIVAAGREIQRLAGPNIELQREIERLKRVIEQAAPGAVELTGLPLAPFGDSPPPRDPSMGDLTPDYARWLVATQSLAAVQAQYAGREQHLPTDVQAALKGGQ